MTEVISARRLDDVALIGVLVQRLGGQVTFTRHDIAALPGGSVLIMTTEPDGTTKLLLESGPQEEVLPLAFTRAAGGADLTSIEITCLGLLFAVRDTYDLERAKAILMEQDANTYAQLRLLDNAETATVAVIESCLSALRERPTDGG